MSRTRKFFLPIAAALVGFGIAAPLVSQLGGYTTLYLTVAVLTVTGSVLVQRVRSVA